jgi:hypothetical protein
MFRCVRISERRGALSAETDSRSETSEVENGAHAVKHEVCSLLRSRMHKLRLSVFKHQDEPGWFEESRLVET